MNGRRPGNPALHPKGVSGACRQTGTRLVAGSGRQPTSRCTQGMGMGRGGAAHGGTGKGKPRAFCCLPFPVPPDTPATPGAPGTPEPSGAPETPAPPGNREAPGAPADSETPPAPPELSAPLRPWPGLDLLGALQAGGGLILGLIALFTSYDHISFAGQRIGLQQQWGLPLIAASVATVFIDSQLASRSRLRAALDAIRAAQDAARSANETASERNLAREERQRADRERNRAAEARERQRESFERLDQAALLSARVQLDPSPTNRARLRAFLTLMAQRPLQEGDGDGYAGMA